MVCICFCLGRRCELRMDLMASLQCAWRAWVLDGQVQGEGRLSDMSWPQAGSSPDTGSLMIVGGDVQAVLTSPWAHTQSRHLATHRPDMQPQLWRQHLTAAVNMHGHSTDHFLQNTRCNVHSFVCTRGRDTEGHPRHCPSNQLDTHVDTNFTDLNSPAVFSPSGHVSTPLLHYRNYYTCNTSQLRLQSLYLGRAVGMGGGCGNGWWGSGWEVGGQGLTLKL